ncbi:hypothetical protein B0J14DRAFT_555398 [Halenospora varia]|nr:hypothetical protein B0J14DRAFT_555398 [Halenospora varia]
MYSEELPARKRCLPLSGTGLLREATHALSGPPHFIQRGRDGRHRVARTGLGRGVEGEKAAVECNHAGWPRELKKSGRRASSDRRASELGQEVAENTSRRRRSHLGRGAWKALVGGFTLKRRESEGSPDKRCTGRRIRASVLAREQQRSSTIGAGKSVVGARGNDGGGGEPAETDVLYGLRKNNNRGKGQLKSTTESDEGSAQVNNPKGADLKIRCIYRRNSFHKAACICHHPRGPAAAEHQTPQASATYCTNKQIPRLEDLRICSRTCMYIRLVIEPIPKVPGPLLDITRSVWAVVACAAYETAD